MTRFANRSVAAAAVVLSVTTAGADDSLRASVAGASLSAEAVQAFATHYETVANRRDVDAINACVNEHVLVDRSRTQRPIADAMWDSFAAGVRQGFDWGASIARAVGEDGHFKILRVGRVEGEPRVLLRMLAGDGGLNYHDLILGASSSGEPEVVDVYVHLSGERLSLTLRRQLEQFLDAQQSNDEAYLRAIRTMERMSHDVQTGRFAGVLEAYDTMPESMQRQRPVQVMRLTSASRVSEDAFRQALRDFRGFFPNDTSVDLLTLDQFVMDEDWLAAIKSLERIRDAVGGDAYLDALIANMVFQNGEVDRAKRLARAAVKSEPTIDQGYWTLLDIALVQEDHPETARILEVLESSFGWAFDDLNAAEAYAQFVQSPHYRQWIETKRLSQVD